MIRITVQNGGVVKASSENAEHLVYAPKYRKGDEICVEVSEPGFYKIRLEDTMLPALVYIEGKARFPIPFGVLRAGYSPRSFLGERHLIEAKPAGAEEVHRTRDLAFNPYDTEAETGMKPHISTNVRYPQSLRNRIFPDIGLFAARNVIDGICASESHRLYPHHSWGINRMADAYLELELPGNCEVDEVILTLRAEFPHDTYWTQALLEFSGPECHEEKIIRLEKTGEEQHFAIGLKGVTKVVLKDLKKADEPSEFPALSQLQIIGR
ncbi:MAG: carbohydrate-binding protein [Lachnospiraceae bacterium]|nr:carbohydrate-binding protein [Lachnospiraceae bacterium]